MSKKITFNLLFLRKNKKGVLEHYSFDCCYNESKGMTEFYNDLITSILRDYSSCFIKNIKVIKDWREIIAWLE
ncbi:MAG: hypothetical protein U9Q73_01770 [Nanoarchaeota archaeon]|nr:hypothetical protein [Nanoarchaeota archaeon]